MTLKTFSSPDLSQCHSAFTYHLNLVLSEEEIKNWGYYHKFYHSSSYCVMSVLNASMRTLTCMQNGHNYKIPVLWLIYSYIFFLTRIEEMLHKTNWTASFSLLCLCTFYLNTLSSLLLSKERLKGKRAAGCSDFPFDVIIFSVNSQLIWGSYI